MNNIDKCFTTEDNNTKKGEGNVENAASSDAITDVIITSVTIDDGTKVDYKYFKREVDKTDKSGNVDQGDKILTLSPYNQIEKPTSYYHVDRV